MTDEIMQFVYYYPPPQMTPEDISAIGGDGYYGLIAVNIDTGTLFGTNIVFMPNATNTAQIFLTPQAFTAWYNTNIAQAAKNQTLTFLAQSAEQPVNGYANMNAETAAYLGSKGFYWKSYNPNYTQYYNVASSAIDPVKAYGFTSNQLYMLILTEQPQETSTQNSQTQNTQTTQNTESNQTQIYNQAAQSNENSQEQQAIQNQQQNTQSYAQQTANAVGNVISKNTTNIEIGLAILGAFVLIAIGVYAYFSHR